MATKPQPVPSQLGDSQSKTSPDVIQQVNLFTGEPEPLRVAVPEPIFELDGKELELDEGISAVYTENMAQVIVSGFGCFLSKKSERILVKRPDGKVLYQFPMFRVSDVIVSSRGIGLSSDLVEELCRRGIRISFLSGNGKPYAMLTSPMLNAVVSTRRAQLAALDNTKGLDLSRAIVRGKIHNQAALLRYFGKHIKQTNSGRFAEIIKAASALRHLRQGIERVQGNKIDDVRHELMGLEGVAGRVYWGALQEILQDKLTFLGRETRGAQDQFNSLLNYGYGILYSHVWGAALNAGLEPFAGYLHVDRPGKPSLVLDLIEEFRQPTVDRVAVSFVNLGIPIKMHDGMLLAETKNAFAEKVLARLSTPEPYQGKHLQVRSIIQQQARRLGSFLRGDAPIYKPFAFKW